MASSDLELAADGLGRIYGLICSDEQIESLVADVRFAGDHVSRMRARDALFRSLASKGIPINQTLSVSLATRVFRTGATLETDRLVRELLDRWNTLDAKYGLRLPVRISAALLAMDPSFSDRLSLIGGKGNEIGTVSLLLWSRGGEVRQRSLQTYNPFGELGSSDTAALRTLISDKVIATIDMAELDWRQKMNAALVHTGAVRLTSPAEGQQQLRTTAVELVGIPIEVDTYHFYPTVEAYRLLANGRIALDLSIRERV